MNGNEILSLTLDSAAFEDMKGDFNKVLQRTLGNMLGKDSKEATLTIKLNIEILEEEVPNWQSADATAMRKINKPKFEHKVSSVMQIKNEVSGSVKGEYELVWDDELQEFVAVTIDNGQRSFFDEEYEGEDAESFDDESEGYEDGNVALLEEGKKLLGAHVTVGDFEGEDSSDD